MRQRAERTGISNGLSRSAKAAGSLRAYGDSGTDAHINPVYLFLEGKRPFDKEACDRILARLDGSIRSIPNREIQRELLLFKEQLGIYRDPGEASELGLPVIPR